jgi:hypothetical protein
LSERRLTPAAERLATLAGATADSFGKGAELLAEMSGIRLSASTVERTTESAGQRVIDAFEAGKTFGPKLPWGWYQDATGQTVGYIALDATGVPQQGEHGEKADGRMAYVGMIFNPLPDRERVFAGLPKPGTKMQARYVSGHYPLAAMGPLLRRQGAQVGLDKADMWVALSDGGNGLEELLAASFPRVGAVILDFWHAAEYLGKLATALHPGDESARKEQVGSWSRVLREEGGETMIGVLEAWDWPTSAAMTAAREEAMTYFRNQRHRMDYPTYVGNGWFIGSGAVESACKTVVNSRLKGTGMRWCEPGSHSVCHMRALYRGETGQWNAFWEKSLAF